MLGTQNSVLAMYDTGEGQPAKRKRRGKVPGAQLFSEPDKKRDFAAMTGVEDPSNDEEDGDELDSVENEDVDMLDEDDWPESRSSHNNAPGVVASNDRTLVSLSNATTYSTRTMEQRISSIASRTNGSYDLDLENSKLS